MEEANPETSRKRKQLDLIETYTVQCGNCDKWRFIESQEEYEEIRSRALEEAFECEDCEEVADVDVDTDSTRLWFVDHHGLPKTPKGFKRILVLRERGDQADVYYVTPKGKRLRSIKEVSAFIQENEEFHGTNMQDVSFVRPKLMKKNKSNSKDITLVAD